MKFLIENASVYTNGGFVKKNLTLSGDTVSFSGKDVSADIFKVFDFNNCYIFPGFVDVHVHFREPGFLYKETIKTGSMAAAHGGYTTVCTMPNLKPAPDCMKNLSVQLDAIRRDSVVNIIPYGTITEGEEGKVLSDMDGMADYVVGFSDDGRGVQDEDMMRRAMLKAKSLGKPIVAHCEDNSLLFGGYIHDGVYAREHGHKGISSESEWKQIERDLRLAKETGCRYHVCHISTKESVELIRRAKADGVDVTCETAPHYLLMNDSMLKDEGRFKMNPPLRDESDRLALIQGIKDGTIDMIATDHAPHSAEEKSKGLKGSLMGIVGLETAFPLLYTGLVKTGIITLEKLILLMSVNPARRFGIGCGIEDGKTANLCVYDLNGKYRIDPEGFLSKGRATPFEGYEVYGKCRMTIAGGKIAWQE